MALKRGVIGNILGLALDRACNSGAAPNAVHYRKFGKSFPDAFVSSLGARRYRMVNLCGVVYSIF